MKKRPFWTVILLGVAMSAFCDVSVAEAKDQVASCFAEVGRHDLALRRINSILDDDPLNVDIVVALAEYAAFRDSGTEFYVNLALFASKARYACDEFLVLADAQQYDLGEWRATLFGARLLAAESTEECDDIMREYWDR